jgi:hypothetical protein
MRRISVVFIALGTVMAALAGCGGSSQKPAALSSGGSSTSTTPSASVSTGAGSSSPSPAATTATTATSATSASVAAGDLSLPADVKLVFDIKPTGDALKDAAVQGWTDEMRALYKAILLGVSDPSSPLIADYTMGNGMNSIVTWINEFKKGNYGVTGTDRYYDIRVLETSTAAGGQGAKITYCEDESKFFGTDKATGKTLLTPVTLKDYSRVTVTVTKNLKTGTWLDGYYSATQGDQQCRTLAG